MGQNHQTEEGRVMETSDNETPKAVVELAQKIREGLARIGTLTPEVYANELRQQEWPERHITCMIRDYEKIIARCMTPGVP